MNNKITLFRNFIGIFLFVSFFSMTANAQTVILSEDFASAASGDNVGNTTQTTLWAGNANFSVDPVPANNKAYEAGGAIKLGTGSATGYIVSAPLNLAQGGGSFTITFDVKGWTTVEGDIKITVTGLPETIVTYTALRTSPAFETKTVTFGGGTANSTIRIETTAKRAFIDNVVVTVPTVVSAPVATAATDVDHDSFTANWTTVDGISQYRFDLSTTPDFSSFVGTYNDLLVIGNSKEVTGLESNTTYYYRVRAVDVALTSANSNVIEATTDCGPFAIPDFTSGEFCPGSTVANLPLSGTAGYNWFANTTDTMPLAATEVLVHGTTYYLMQTVNNCDSERAPYVVNVAIVEAPFYPEPEIEVCHSGTIADITPENSGYLFYESSTATTPLAGTTPLVNGATYFVSRMVGECESTRTDVMVEIEIPAIPAGDDTQSFTAGQTLADLAVTADEELVWYAEASLETELDPSTPLMNNITYYAVNVDAPCVSEYLAVTVQQTMGTSLFGMEGLTAYPNPVNNVFTVTYTEAINNVTVYNMLGQVVVSNSSNATSAQVNVAGLAAGTYTVKVVSGSQTANFKIVKQ
jgi:hypothetical protein